MIAFITYDEEHHRLAIGYVPDLRDRDQGVAGVDHFAFAFGSLGDLLANYIRLKNIGILPYWCINHGPTTSLYYRDLDGNQIETQVDRSEEHTSELQSLMRISYAVFCLKQKIHKTNKAKRQYLVV